MAQSKEKKAAYSRAYYESHKEELVAYIKEYLETNKEKVAAQRKEYRESHKEEIAAKDKVYRDANKKKIAAKDKAYKEANKKELAAKKKEYYSTHKEERAIYHKAWRRINPDKLRMIAARRLARKKGAEGRHTLLEIKDLIEKQAGICAYGCGRDIRKKYEKDHIIPLAYGGSDYIDNICIACPRCNRRKGTKSDKEFRDLLSKEKEDESV